MGVVRGVFVAARTAAPHLGRADRGVDADPVANRALTRAGEGRNNACGRDCADAVVAAVAHKDGAVGRRDRDGLGSREARDFVVVAGAAERGAVGKARRARRARYRRDTACHEVDAPDPVVLR